MYHQAMYEDDLRIKSSKGKKGVLISPSYGDEVVIPSNLERKSSLSLPELTELDVIRHYIRLSQMNYGVDVGFYPLGSCTMKYNPKIAERIAAHSQVQKHHPMEPNKFVQGNLHIAWHLSKMLCSIAGVDDVSLQPSAGAQAEFMGAKILRAYHESRGEMRDEMIIPDSAHGTNPASSAMAGFRVVEVPSNEFGALDIDALKVAVSDRTAGIMLTNPNTLGIFEKEIEDIEKIIHRAGGLLYYDGANLNALLGRVRPGDMGFDVVHFNLHKTFATPHGGGGPGAGAIGVKSFLSEFLPVPFVIHKEKSYELSYVPRSHSIGSIRPFIGNFAILVRAYTYLLSIGSELEDVSEGAVLNANYLASKLKGHFEMPYSETTPLRKHEFVISCEKIKLETGVSALNIARRLLDFGYHAPTVYFPLIVKEALMIEPTETESKEELDTFADVLIQIKDECYSKPDLLFSAPHNTSRKSLDLVAAARHPVLSWMMEK